LQHYLASGRSLDSNKRRFSRANFETDTEEAELISEEFDSGHSVITVVSTRELISLLSPALAD